MKLKAMVREAFALIVAVLAFLSGAASASGSLMSVFDAAEEVGLADVIVIGHLSPDGTLAQTSVLKGEPEPSGVYALDAHFHKPFRSLVAETGPIEVVAFLSRQKPNGYRVVMEPAGLVAFAGDGKVACWLPLGAFADRNAALGIHPTWNREVFLKLIGDSLKTDHALELILAQPKSSKRISDALEFLRVNVPWVEYDEDTEWKDSSHGSFLLSKTTQGFRQPSPEEEEALARELAAATRTEVTERILAVIADASCSNKLYDQVRPYLEPTHEAGVRREACRALARIDPYQAAGVLATFLKAEEPEVECILSALSQCAREADPELLNRAVIEPLREFATSSLQSGRLDPAGAEPQLQYILLHTLCCYFHPRLLPVMMKWADESSLPTRAQATSNVRSSLWLEDKKARYDECKAWWIRNRQVIEQCPEPTDPPSGAGWLGVFDKNTDPMSRKFLLRLWVFQPELRERELLAACSGPSAESAKILLAELWQQKRLSLETRKQLVHDFLRLRIVVRKYPHTDRSPKTRVKAIEGERQFPFPEAAWVDMQATYGDGRLPVLNRNEGPGSNFSLKGPVRSDFCGGTGSVDETKYAVVEIFENSFGISPPKTLWRLRWELKEGEDLKQGKWTE